MKTTSNIRQIHEECKARYGRLAGDVKEVLKHRCEKNGWFYYSRVKELESFALKIETGRVPDPSKMDDFFACTIVVPTISNIDRAVDLVNNLYDPLKRRPKTVSETHKESCSFPFDDLRLYVAQRQAVSGKNTDLDGIVFEVQIKTILQHAWAVATHDLIYKSNTISWPLERIAFQVKAMLEHAEVAIAEANNLAGAPAVAKTDSKSSNILTIINNLELHWTKEQLPTNVKRLAETIYSLLCACDVSVEGLIRIISKELEHSGSPPVNLSPYSFIIQSLANKADLNFIERIRKDRRIKVVIHRGMALPEWMWKDHPQILVID